MNLAIENIYNFITIKYCRTARQYMLLFYRTVRCLTPLTHNGLRIIIRICSDTVASRRAPRHQCPS